MTRINTNVSSLVAQNTLSRSNTALNQALTRLSTGLRINTGKDDPAGLIASENLRSDISSIKRAIGNTDRANQVIATADSALGQVSSLLNDIRGLVTESANTGALSDEQIAANQLQIDSSLEALNRIAQTTTFQGRRLLDGSLDFITTAGAGFNTLTDLKIDQANLGATGQVAVNVDIRTAATRALITNTAVPAGSGSGVQATGTLTFSDGAVPSAGSVQFAAVTTAATSASGSTTFTVETAPATQASGTFTTSEVSEVLASGTSATLTNGGTLTVTAVSGGIAGGASGSNYSVTLIDAVAPTAAVLNGNVIEVTADFTNATINLNDIVNAIDTADFGSGVGNDFDASATLGGSQVDAADAGVGVVSLSGGVSAVAANTITVTALAGGAADGLVGDSIDIEIVDGLANTAVLVGTTLTVTADISGGVGSDDIANLIQGSGGGLNFTASSSGTDNLVAADETTHTDPLTGGANATTDTAQLDIETDPGDVDTTIEFVFGTPTSGNVSISGAVGGTITVTLNDNAAFQLSEIATELAGYAGIASASFASNGTLTIDNTTDSAPADATITGGDDAISTAQTITIEGVDGEVSNIDISIVESNTVLNGTPVVSGDAANGYVISVSDTATTTVQAIRAAIAGLAEVATATYAGTAVYDPTANSGLAGAGIDETLAGGSDSAEDVITVTAAAAGTAANGVTITIVEANGHGLPTAAITGGNIVVTVDDTAATTITQIATAINNLAAYNATVTTSDGDGNYVNGTDDAVAGILDDGEASGGLDDALVVEVAGASGAEVLSFGVGTSLTQIVAAINGASDATGVAAFDNAGTLEIRSTAYGSGALVSVNVLDGDANDTFGDGLSAARANGTDIVATVNGIEANGKGNTLSVNTATLDLTVTVQEGSSTDVNFTIIGGGALFQLGPDVVSNQQARIGITSVNTAKLGGVSGKLFQLGSGGNSDLTSNNLNGAAQIVEEAINQITSLRGRLGAFQRTTLETNKQALNDTLINLTEAESLIRDADFAAETAALTRAQILVQSGTVVLQITNQNPQNVLSLLR